MLAGKRAGLHPTAGTTYYWSLAVLCLTAAVLAAMRWNEDAHLLWLGAVTFGLATTARLARRHRWKYWMPIHIVGMGGSYTVMIAAFYVDNGKNLPLWRELPALTYWLVPASVGTLLIVRALWRRRSLYAPGFVRELDEEEELLRSKNRDA